MLTGMLLTILRRLLFAWCALCAICMMSWADTAIARTVEADIARVSTPLAIMERVRIRLDWPAEAISGRLQLQVGALDAADLGYRFRDLGWTCDLQRNDSDGWRCNGTLRSRGTQPAQLSVDLGTAFTDLRLQQGKARLEVHRQAAAPDDTRVDLVQVPVAWAQALLDLAWKDGRMKAGTFDAGLVVSAAKDQPLQVSGPLNVSGFGLETPDASIAAESLNGRFDLDYRIAAAEQRIALAGNLHGGEWLFGSTYVSLPTTPVALELEAVGQGGRWSLPKIRWHDGRTMTAQGSAALSSKGELQALDIDLVSNDLAPVAQRYLSGWLGSVGLGDLLLQGKLRTSLELSAEGLRLIDAHFDDVAIGDNSVFGFEGLNGDLRYSSTTPVSSTLRWGGGQVYGLEFDAAELPLRSAGGAIELLRPASFAAVGGKMRFDRFVLRPPSGAQGMQTNFALTLDALDVGKLAKTLGWPAFRGTLSGSIPDARYIDDRLVFEGGLDMRVFNGSVEVSSLSMERPFGVAPTLSADLVLNDLDLLAVTEVFDFGSISGRMDGSIRGLRLVDWNATDFDAELHTVPKRGVRQRISQRAVQNISSVGDASFVTSLQGQLIGLFDDFGYRRIGISCRLRNQTCAMGGLEGARSDSGGFTIVQGAGVPRLDVVGFNRQVDWPALVERLAAIGKGEVKPVFESPTDN